MGEKIGKPLPVPTQTIKTLQAKVGSAAYDLPATVQHFDRDGDGKADAFMISDDQFVSDGGASYQAKRDYLILLDGQGRTAETFLAYDGVVRQHSEITWQDDNTGTEVTDVDRNGNGVPDWHIENEVEVGGSVSTFDRCEIPPSARLTEHFNAKTKEIWDDNEDGIPDRVRPKQP